jgi:hypothetical protein
MFVIQHRPGHDVGGGALSPISNVEQGLARGSRSGHRGQWRLGTCSNGRVSAEVFRRAAMQDQPGLRLETLSHGTAGDDVIGIVYCTCTGYSIIDVVGGRKYRRASRAQAEVLSKSHSRICPVSTLSPFRKELVRNQSAIPSYVVTGMHSTLISG